ncbi:MAG: DUF2254 domain-containing protein [Chloroflexia bacterium]
MKTNIIKAVEQARSSLWVLPAAITLIAGLLAFLLVEIDRRAGSNTELFRLLPWAFEGGAESARAVLTTIAGSMITLAGTVYSITIVALTLASMQFAPRVLRGFMRDRSNQVVLGFFVATFTYCLLVLRTVRSEEGIEFVPGRAVAGGVVLALVSLGMLIYFIDHIFHGIQVSSIINSVTNETVEQINHIYPEPWSADDLQADPLPGQPMRVVTLPDDWTPIPANQSGYLQYIDYKGLFSLAVQASIVVKQERPNGSFVLDGGPLVYISPASSLTPTLRGQINAAFVLGNHPTMQQDVAYGIRRLVDIALKAISPAVNDPTTALNCIDYLGAILATLGNRKLPELDRADSSGQVRLIVYERTFHDLVRLAFDQIRHYGAADPVIGIRLLDTIGHIAQVIKNPANREVLCEHIEKIVSGAERTIADPYELEVVRKHAAAAREKIHPSSRA